MIFEHPTASGLRGLFFQKAPSRHHGHFLPIDLTLFRGVTGGGQPTPLDALKVQQF